MTDFTVEAKRVKSGESLTQMNNQAIGAIGQLKQIKINILALRASVVSDPDFEQEDVDVIDSISTALLTEIATI